LPRKNKHGKLKVRDVLEKYVDAKQKVVETCVVPTVKKRVETCVVAAAMETRGAVRNRDGSNLLIPLQKEEARVRASRKNARRYNARGVKKWQGVPEEEKLKKFCDVERPHTKKDLCNFLESARYFRKFIPEFAATALPLKDKTKKGRPDVIVWDRVKRLSRR
jgi:hypothetical protein